MNKREILDSGNIFYKYNASGSAKKSPKLKTSNKSYDTNPVMKKESIADRETYSFVGTKEVIDRDGDIVIIDGMDFKNFNNNPVVLWGHDAHSTPIGKVVGVTKDIKEKSLIFDIQFASTAKGQEVETLVKEGMLNATSIGFMIKDWEYDDTLDAYKFTETELLEISIVNIPANQEAILEDKSYEQETKVSEEDLRAMIAEVVQDLLPKQGDDEAKEEDEGKDSEEVETPQEEPETDSQEPKEEPKEEKEDQVEPESLEGSVQVDTVEDEPKDSSQDTMVELLRQIAEALTAGKNPEEAQAENTETDSQEEQPKESEENQQPDEPSSENEIQDDNHSEEESPEDKPSDEINLVNVEDLDEDTEFTVVI